MLAVGPHDPGSQTGSTRLDRTCRAHASWYLRFRLLDFRERSGNRALVPTSRPLATLQRRDTGARSIRGCRAAATRGSHPETIRGPRTHYVRPVSGSKVVRAESARAETNRWFARGVGFAAGGLLVVGLISATIGAASVVLLVFVALLIASALRPLVDRLRTVLPVGRGPAILLVYFSFFAAVAGTALLLVPIMASQTSDLAAQLPAVDQRLEAWATNLRPRELASSVGAVIAAAKAALDRGPLVPPPGQLVSAGLGLAEAIAAVVTVLALVYFWLTERQRLQRFALSFLPSERRGSAREAWNSVELRLGGWVRGQLALMLALGVMTGAAYSLLGLPSGPLLGVVAGLAEVIPFIGPLVGVVPALLLAA